MAVRCAQPSFLRVESISQYPGSVRRAKVLTGLGGVSLASVKGHIEIDKARCKGCAFCIDFCPRNSIELSEELNLKGYFVAAFRDGEGLEDGKECNGCGTCALMCPEVAIEVVRE
jgi:2-oxoglutarate ferredoxin oxidoreductase subunit delta